MRAKHLFIDTAVMLAAALSAGLYCKASYLDFNQEEAPLERFLVGLLPDDLVERQIGRMKKELPDSPLIAAVRCTEKTKFLFGCTTQEAEVLHVFRGEELEEGQRIDTIRASSMIFDTAESGIETNEKGPKRYSINMGFVNEMTPGKEYLLFLDHKEAEIPGGNTVYRMSDEFLMATVFCYEETESIPQESIDSESLSAYYTDVKDSEFFVMSRKAVKDLNQFKKRLFQKYPY